MRFGLEQEDEDAKTKVKTMNWIKEDVVPKLSLVLKDYNWGDKLNLTKPTHKQERFEIQGKLLSYNLTVSDENLLIALHEVMNE